MVVVTPQHWILWNCMYVFATLVWVMRACFRVHYARYNDCNIMIMIVVWRRYVFIDTVLHSIDNIQARAALVLVAL